MKDKKFCELNYVPTDLETAKSNPLRLWAAIAAYDLSSEPFVIRVIKNFQQFTEHNVKVTLNLDTTVAWNSTEFVNLLKAVQVKVKVVIHRLNKCSNCWNSRYSLVQKHRPELTRVIDKYDWFMYVPHKTCL